MFQVLRHGGARSKGRPDLRKQSTCPFKLSSKSVLIAIAIRYVQEWTFAQWTQHFPVR